MCLINITFFGRELKYNKMVREDDRLITGTNNMMAKKGASTSHLKLYDLPYKTHDYSNIKDDISADGIGWNTVDEPKNTYPDTSWAEGTSIWDQPSHETENYEYGYHSQPSRVIIDHHRPIQQKENKIDWRTIGILAFIKLGLVKLQAIGFIQILFLIVFKLKLYMIAVFLKFLLIMKLMKLSKILVLPLLFLQLLPTLMQLLSMRPFNNMMNLLGTSQPNQLSGSIPSQSSNILPGGTTGTLQPGGITGTGQIGGTGTAQTDGITGTGQASGTGAIRPGGIPGAIRPGGIPGANQPGGTPGAIRPGGIPGTGQTKKLSSFKFDDINLISKQLNKSSMLFDPTWEIFQKILNSEICIERIACQMSVAEKAGIMPFWISW